MNMNIGPKHSTVVSPQLTAIVKETKNTAVLFSSVIPNNLHSSRHKFGATIKPPKIAMHAARVTEGIAERIVVPSGRLNIAYKASSIAKGTLGRATPPKKNLSLQGKNVEREPTVGMNLFDLRSKTKISKHSSS